MSSIYLSCVSASLEGRIIEYVDHLHEHFLDPATISNGRYLPPIRPGYSIAMRPESLDMYEFPTGLAWAAIQPLKSEGEMAMFIRAP
jgi:L-fuconate dehydratase